MKKPSLPLLWTICTLIVYFVNCSAQNVAVETNTVGKELLSDEPLQLIHPDETHTKLILNEEAYRALHSLKAPFAVVSVVGPYHSGKSFLLNQLMSRTTGFTIGPTVQPSTMGLWVWGKPIKLDGSETSILFLDTEGFYSSNVSEAYDAKIFGVATLLSSYVIFNSVKVIDQSSIENVEILARRTQLFGLKAELSNPNRTSSDIEFEKLLAFPPLLWVVRDFVQDLESKTPTQWLASLLSSYRRDQEDHKEQSALQSIFPSIECHPLFLPHTERNKLRHLDEAKEEELTPDYREDMKSLRQKVITSAPIKRGLSGDMNGPELASLLKLLVSQANEGAFPQVPSVWRGFLALQRQQAQSDAIETYKKGVLVFREGPVLNQEEFKQLSEESSTRALDLFKQLLFGMKNVYEEALADLQANLKELHQLYSSENDKRIDQEIKSIYEALLKNYEDSLQQVTLPMASKHLELLDKKLSEEVKAKFEDAAKKFKRTHPYQYYSDALQKGMSGSYANYALKNLNLIDTKLNEAMAKALNVYEAQMNLSEAVSNSLFHELHKASEALMWATFNGETEFAQSEKTYPLYQTQTEAKMRELFDIFRKQNEAAVEKLAAEEVDRETKKFQDLLKPVYSLLPLEDSELDQQVRQNKEKIFNSYKEALYNYTDLPSYTAKYHDLERKIQEQVELVYATNIQQLKLACQEALDRAKKRIVMEADDYYLTWSFINMVYARAEEEIDGAIKSHATKKQVIKVFLEKELEEAYNNVYLKTKRIAAVGMIVIAISMYILWRIISARTAAAVVHKPKPQILRNSVTRKEE